jgi:hypothetical protein
MRRTFIALTLVGLSMALAVLDACGDDTAHAPVSDGGVVGDATNENEGGPGDGAVAADAALEDNVSVTVVGEAGVLVVFHDATGAVIESKVTNASGTAKSEGALPAMATVLVQHGDRHEIVTWVGVERGDRLVLRDPTKSVVVGSYEVTFPGPFSDAGFYSVFTGSCGTGTNTKTTTYPLSPACSGAENSILGAAFGSGTDPIAFSIKKGVVPPTDGGTLAVTTEAWTAPGATTVTVDHAPETSHRAVQLTSIASGLPFTGNLAPLVDGGQTFAVPSTFADNQQASFFVDGAEKGAWRAVSRRVGAGARNVALDFATAPPELGGEHLGGDAQRFGVLWTGATADTTGGVVRVSFRGQYVGEGYAWTFIVPPGTTKLTAPAIPSAGASFLPEADAGTSGFVKPEIAFVKTDILANYRAFRQQANVLGLIDGSHFVPPLQEDGQKDGQKDGTMSITFLGRTGSLD